jgi:predicted  nucleic acid-binding Zn-ribbon protein
MVSDLAAASRDLRSVSEVARVAEQELQQVAAQFAQQGTTLDHTADRHQALLEQYRSVFDRIQQGLGAVLQQLADGMQRYHEASRTGLREHLEEFDNHLAAATQQIKGSVEGIREGLETLTDAIDSAATRIGGDGKGGK